MKTGLAALVLFTSLTSWSAKSRDVLFSLPDGKKGHFHACADSWVAFKTNREISVYKWSDFSIHALKKLSPYQDVINFVDEVQVSEGSNTFTRALFIQKDSKSNRLCVILSDKERGQWNSSGGTKYTATPYFIDAYTIVRDPELIIAYRDMDLDGEREPIRLTRHSYQTSMYERRDIHGDIFKTEIAPWSSSFSCDGKFYTYYLLSTNSIPSLPVRDVENPQYLLFEGERYCIDKFMVNIEAPLSTDRIASMGKWEKSQPER
mgnify:CR=1 FL=1